jgi:hypothetical protein
VVLRRGEWVGWEMGIGTGMGCLTRGSVLRTLEGLEEALLGDAILANCLVRIRVTSVLLLFARTVYYGQVVWLAIILLRSMTTNITALGSQSLIDLALQDS